MSRISLPMYCIWRLSAPWAVMVCASRTATPQTEGARFMPIACLSNIQNTNGRPGQLTSADPRFVDYYNRPWAKVWEKYFEVGWEKPDDSVPAELLDIFK